MKKPDIQLLCMTVLQIVQIESSTIKLKLYVITPYDSFSSKTM